jgi:hypothetical protein
LSQVTVAVVALGGRASKTDVHRWDVGKDGVRLENLQALAQVLGLTVEQLVHGQDD